ncbi:MAG: LacI family transcriptional regulator [Bacteroidales bacterium]|nr:LacI family transcriptional regulator [Bacteroidales bacterium]
MSRKVSLKDIANRVGVSTALVSFVLNGQGKEKRVGAEMMTKILETAREMNYQPNEIARSLRKGSTMTLGLIVADISNPFFGQLARVIEDEALRFGYTVIFGSSDESDVKSALLIDTFLNRQADGFIIVPAEGTENQVKNLIQKMFRLSLSTVFFQAYPLTMSCSITIRPLLKQFAILSIKVTKEIGIFAYKNDMVHMQERILGYVDAMKSRQLEENIIIKEIGYGNIKLEVENAIYDLVVKKKLVDALYFVTNALSISGLYSLSNHGILVPQQLAIMGFDENEAYDFFIPH